MDDPYLGKLAMSGFSDPDVFLLGYVEKIWGKPEQRMYVVSWFYKTAQIPLDLERGVYYIDTIEQYINTFNEWKNKNKIDK